MKISELIDELENRKQNYGYMEFGSIGSAVVQVFRADDNDGGEVDEK